MKRIAAMAADAGITWTEKPGKSKGPHDTYLLGGRRLPIPRHREINELTARGIIQSAQDVIDGKDQPR